MTASIQRFTLPNGPLASKITNQAEGNVGASEVSTVFVVPPDFNYLTVMFPTLTASTKMWVKVRSLAGTATQSITTMRDTRGSSYPAASFGANSIRTFLVPPASSVTLSASRVTATYSIAAFAHKG